MRHVGDVLMYVYFEGTTERRELVDTPERLIELSAKFDVSDDELGQALAIIGS